MKLTTKRTLPIAAAAAVGALLTGAVAVGTGDRGAADAQPSASAAELLAAAATGSAPAASGHDAAGHDHGAAAPGAAPVVPLSRTCADSDLPPHDGNQIGPACVSTQFGEVPAAENVPQLLITDAPEQVAVGQPFTIKVSTRNLVRDRFLAAAQGGYYLERSILNDNGLVRGHFHTACRVLDNAGQAPKPERQAVFVATEDGGGGAAPDTVTVKIPGLAAAGEAQCTTWAGDGSHRIPMQVFANQVPAVDSVRIQVGGDDEVDSPANAGTGQRTEATPRTKATPRTEGGRRPDANQRNTDPRNDDRQHTDRQRTHDGQ
ncbi:MAG: hypothetical protein JWP40_4351 [Blastococcus sp.]|jgi:hypothetical protein|nr:hypothetical protein [Blastococcus sp.]